MHGRPLLHSRKEDAFRFTATSLLLPPAWLFFSPTAFGVLTNHHSKPFFRVTGHSVPGVLVVPAWFWGEDAKMSDLVRNARSTPSRDARRVSSSARTTAVPTNCANDAGSFCFLRARHALAPRTRCLSLRRKSSALALLSFVSSRRPRRGHGGGVELTTPRPSPAAWFSCFVALSCYYRAAMVMPLTSLAVISRFHPLLSAGAASVSSMKPRRDAPLGRRWTSFSAGAVGVVMVAGPAWRGDGGATEMEGPALAVLAAVFLRPPSSRSARCAGRRSWPGRHVRLPRLRCRPCGGDSAVHRDLGHGK